MAAHTPCFIRVLRIFHLSILMRNCTVKAQNKQWLNLRSLINSLHNCFKICTTRSMRILPLENLEEKPQSICHTEERIHWAVSGRKSARNCKRSDGDSLESISWQKICQSHQHSQVMPAESRSLLWKKCHLLLSIMIITDCPLFWVNDCKPDHWQDKMTSAETGSRMFQMHRPHSAFMLMILIAVILSTRQMAASGSTTLSPTHQNSRHSNKAWHSNRCEAIKASRWKGKL